MRARKGSLSMGIQAIVVLVLAMAILGLGLSFLRSVIGKGQENVIRAIDNAQLQNPATSDDPITVDRQVNGRPGQSVVVGIGAYGGQSGMQNAAVAIQCHSALTIGPGDVLSVEQSIPANTAAAFQAIIKIPSGAQAGLYPCSVSVGSLSEQTIVQVVQ